METPIRNGAAGANTASLGRRSARSLRLGSLAGIDIYVHWTFLLLLGWIGISDLFNGGGMSTALKGIVLVLAVFGIVVLHELGHALMARRFGIGTRDITLLPIGGVASLERMPDDPKQELLVAVAGPAVNFFLAGVCFLILAALGQSSGTQSMLVVGGPLVAKLMWINLGLGAFNLLPAFPMDGGRALRAILALRLNHMRATDIAARVGQVLAVGLGILGLFVNPMLLFIAFFVWTGARGEASMEHVRTSIAGVTVREIMQGGRSLQADESLWSARSALSSPQEAFPVVDCEAVIGVVKRDDLLRATAVGSSQLVRSIMTRDVALAEPSAPLTRALQSMGQSSANVLFAVNEGKLVGMVTPSIVRDVILMRDAATRA